jgi:hypothetical protein
MAWTELLVLIQSEIIFLPGGAKRSSFAPGFDIGRENR